MIKPKQLQLLKKTKSAYGGELLKTREGRSKPRPISVRQSMHLVLRSSKAVKTWSFLRSENKAKINLVVQKFSIRYGVKIISMAHAGNHLHLHLKFSNRLTYKPFIRAITSAIAIAIMGNPRWTKQIQKKYKCQATEQNQKRQLGQALQQSLKMKDGQKMKQNTIGGKFWDYRPFTRVVESFKAYLNLQDYIKINVLEGYGYSRDYAGYLVKNCEVLSSG